MIRAAILVSTERCVYLALLGVCCVVFNSVLLVPVALAQTTLTWDGGGDGTSWSDFNNWNPDVVPNDTHDVVIDSSVSVVIGSGVSALCASLVLGESSGSVTPVLGFTTDASGSLSTSTASGGTGNVTIYDGATLQSQRSSSVGEGAGRVIVVGGDLNINTGGTISADSFGLTAFGSALVGGSHGGAGANSSPGSTYGSFANPLSLGQGGYRSPGDGGGAIALSVAGTLTVDGAVSADGGSRSDYGAGAGGSINITAANLAGAGTIRANGGDTSNSNGRGGGGGRIAFSVSGSDSFAGTIQAHGGTGGHESGQAGTVYLSAARRANLVLGGSGNLRSLRLGSDGTNDYTFGTISIQSGGTLEIEGNSSENAPEGMASVISASSIDIQVGGVLSANALGDSAHQDASMGASHGGAGASALANSTYGSLTNPTSLGLGSYYIVGAGGGAVVLSVSGTLTVDGAIAANGGDVANYGAGAGGSIRLSVANLGGSGVIQANGGNSTGDAGRGGGGGRIAFDVSGSDTFSGTIQAHGGSGGRENGHAGTIYLSATRRANLVLGGAGNIDALRLGSDGTNDYTFGTITIQNGGLLELDGNSSINSPEGGASFVYATTINVDAGGAISADTLGRSNRRDSTLGGSHGGAGGNALANSTYGSFDYPTSLGEGSYYIAGAGGGAILLSVTGTLTIDGTITANGGDVSDYSAGAGGSINLTAANLAGAGLIRANGGDATGSNGRGGGGGRIAFTVSGSDTFSGTIQAHGGSGGGENGQAGTIYLGAARRANLIIGGAGNLSTLRLGSDGTNDYSFDAITIQDGGLLELEGNSSINSPEGGANVIYAASIDLQAGGTISADTLGQSNRRDATTGGSHGGAGGNALANSTFGSFTNPTSLGLGSYYVAGAGGGAVLLSVSGTLTVNGTITADGGDVSDHSAGAGGSINLSATNFSGSGIIRANGGDSIGSSGRGGGGGRIAFAVSGSDTFEGTIQAHGGTGGTAYGQAGTVYLSAARRANLVVGGAGNPSVLRLGSDGTNNYTFGTITIANGGTLEIAGNSSINAPEGGASVLAATTIDVQSGGLISANSLGHSNRRDPTLGGSHGGLGGNVFTANTFGSFTSPTSLGEGGYERTPGGGAIILAVSGTLTVDGAITANGASRQNHSAGAGGSINITAADLAGTGLIRANGGTSPESSGMGGGGGRIALEVSGSDTFSGTVEAHGGSGGSRIGRTGTIYLSAARRANLVIGGAGNISSLRLGSDGLNDYTFGTITIQNGGTLEIGSNTNLNAPIGSACVVNVSALDLQSGGSLSANSLGQSYRADPLLGGSFGGVGGNRSSGSTYGSFTNPIALGEAGYELSAVGGGALILAVTGTLNVDGTMSANGGSANNHSAAAGGSINITAVNLTGAGVIQANGGNSTDDAGMGGGGGRIAFDISGSDTFSGSIEAHGGSGGNKIGHAGTIYLSGARRANLVLGGSGNLSTLRLGSDGVTNHSFGTITIQSGGTLEIDSDPSADAPYGAASTISATTIDIQTGGRLSANALGGSSREDPLIAGSHGGIGGNDLLGSTYGSFTNPTTIGEAGYQLEAVGGGAIILDVSGTLTVNGTLSADGGSPAAYGAGAGGSINISAANVAGSGLISANGGSSAGSIGRGGGGGRIAFDISGSDTFSGTIQAHGGTGSTEHGRAGTIYLSAEKRANLVLGGAGNLSTLRLGTDGTNDYTFGSITVQLGSVLEIDGHINLNAGTGGVTTIHASSIDVQAGASISAAGMGFSQRAGPAGAASDFAYAASHGGMGADQTRATYGSLNNPSSLGSGGSRLSGGGAIALNVSGALLLDGVIDASGNSGDYPGGAGGSVNIRADTLSGTGRVLANAGDNTHTSYPRGSGGGRIAVRLFSGTDFGGVTFEALGGDAGGASTANGAAGTIYLQDANDSEGDGDLIVDNNSVVADAGSTTLISNSMTDLLVGDVLIQNAAELEMDSAVGLTVSGDWTNASTQTLTNGTVVFDGTGTHSIDSNNQNFASISFDDGGVRTGVWSFAASPLTVSRVLGVLSGTLSIGTQTLRINDSGFTGTAITVGANGALSNISTGNLVLGGGVANAGAITFDSPGPSDAILISSTSAGVQRNWQGSGVFAFNDVVVQDQAAIGSNPPYIVATYSTDSGNNTNWLFNAPPVAGDLSPPSFNEDTQSVVTLGYTDLEGDPAIGCAVSNLNNLTVATPCACVAGTCTTGVTGTSNYHGPASFTYTVNGSGPASNVATVSLTVNAVEDAPVASNINPASFNEDTASVVTLSYTDAEGDQATSCTVWSPTNVSVTTPCACVTGTCRVGVTGASNFNGAASFLYAVTAVGGESNSATASLTVDAVDDAPIASNIIPPSFEEDAESVVVLSYSDIDGHPATACTVLGLSRVAETTSCACVAGSCRVGITGLTNYNGSASFSYTVTANGALSNVAMASLTINPVTDYYSISGNITDGSEALSGVTVTLSGGHSATTSTNASGAFSFRDVPEGIVYTVTASAPGYTFLSQTGTITTDVSHNFTGIPALDDEDDEGSTIRGILTVVGRPVAEAKVSLQTPSDPPAEATTSNVLLWTLTDRIGEYEFSNVPSGTYSLKAEIKGVILSSTEVELVPEVETLTTDLPVAEATSLNAKVYALWNGYLDMVNILELANKGDETLSAAITLYGVSTASSARLTPRETIGVSLEPGQKRDIPLSELVGDSTIDSYGFVEVSANHGYLEGGISVYRSSLNALDAFDFAFHAPLSNALVGTGHVLFNTFQPAPANINQVLNWLTLANPTAERAMFTLHYYNDRGDLESTSGVVVPAFGRVDIDGGHQTIGANSAGLLSVVPASDTRPYYAALSRYSANSETDYAFAITQAATFGESEPQIIAVTNLRNTRSYLETSNVLGSQVEMKLTWHDQNGVELGTLLAPIGPKATVHIPLMNQLPEGFSGSLRMEADNASALVAQSIVYQYDQGYQEVLEAQQVVPISSFATKLSTSFNLYLGMANWLRLINLSDSSVEVVLNYSAEYGQTYTLKAHARTDIAVHELPLSADSYGALTLEVNRAAGLGGELVRARQDSAGKFEMLTTIPLR